MLRMLGPDIGNMGPLDVGNAGFLDIWDLGPLDVGDARFLKKMGSGSPGCCRCQILMLGMLGPVHLGI